MVTIDYLLLAILALSAFMGVFRGFVKEALSLLGWVVAIWCAWQFGGPIANWLPSFVGDPVIRLWSARLCLVISVLILSGVVSAIISFMMGRSGLDGTDRVIGMVFGLARGVILIGVTVNLLQFAGFEQDPWWDESKLIPYAAPIADTLSEIAGEGIELLNDSREKLEVSLVGRKG
jgi:membrane protein required for colicin V production